MRKTMLGAAIAMATMAAITAHASTTRDLESSAVINGSIVVAKDGTVQSAAVDDVAKFGQPITDMVRKTAEQWRFKPVLRDGEPVLAKASMHVRVVIKKTADGNFSAWVKGATFGDGDPKSTDELHKTQSEKNTPPHYPLEAVKYRVQGTVYLALHVDRNGHVTEAVARQVNLDAIGQDRVLTHYRKVLADSALEAARTWSFQVPTSGPLAHKDSWTADVPINYYLNEWDKPKAERVWETYVPGPYTPAPWVDQSDVNAADAVVDDGVRTEGIGLTLLPQTSHN